MTIVLRKVWDSYGGRVLWGSVLLFLFVPTLVGLLWKSLGWKFPDGYSLGVYIGTGIAVLWYTVETYSLRQEVVRQNETTIRPLVLSLIEERDPSLPAFVLRNIGHGPALFVEVSSFMLNVRTRGECRIEVSRVDLVEPNEKKDPPWIRAKPERGGRVPDLGEIVDSLMAGPGHAVANCEITITYENVEQRRFVSVMQMGMDGTKLLYSKRLPRPALSEHQPSVARG